MNFLETLRAHKGGLIRLKTALFWYGVRDWDGNPGRICLILDTAPSPALADAEARTADYDRMRAAVLLLIDGRPHWVWIAPADVELL